MTTPLSLPFLTVRDVANELRLDRSTVYRLVERGEIPAVRVGGSIRIDPAELRAYIYGPPPEGHA